MASWLLTLLATDATNLFAVSIHVAGCEQVGEGKKSWCQVLVVEVCASDERKRTLAPLCCSTNVIL